MNIKIDEEDVNFKFRVAAIIEHENKILSCQIMKNGFYCLPGGHCHLGEDSTDALVREIFEETGVKINVGRLGAIIENFFTGKNSKTFHEICLIYKTNPIELPSDKCKDWSVVECDEDGEKLLEFKWFDKNDVEEIKPKVISKILNANSVKHFIIKDNVVTEVL